MSVQTTNEAILCVDLDGTLTKTDILVESTLALIKSRPQDIFRLPVWLLKGKAHLKQKIADATELKVENLPYNQDFLDYLCQEKEKGRKLILATASNIKFASQISDHLGIFDQVIASSATENLSGQRKLEKLTETLAGQSFDYAGNDKSDIAVWRGAQRAILVDPEVGVHKAATKVAEIDKVFENQTGRLKEYLRACRLYQWIKNILIFVPLATSHKISDTGLMLDAVLGFLCFGLCASSVYVVNDLLDLDADRQHPRKKNRPFAAGTVPVKHALVMVPALLAAGLGLALLTLPLAFCAVLGLYLTVTLFYSVRLKSIVLVDVLVLAGLYTLRIIAGAAAVDVPVSFWLLGFSVFLFLSLAMVKRYSELQGLREKGDTASAAGRGYQVVDLDTLISLGTSAGYAAVLVLALYVNSEEVKVLYSYPPVIWLLCPVALYWVSRVWLKTRREEMHDDPIVFAAKDPVSRLVAIIGVVILLVAK